MKNYTLPKEFGTKWIAALKSGEYDKTKGQFIEKNDETLCFCANGLAYHSNDCEISNFDIVTYNGNTNSIWNSTCTLPVHPNLVDIIVKLNDDYDYSFPEIADWIEDNVEFI